MVAVVCVSLVKPAHSQRQEENSVRLVRNINSQTQQAVQLAKSVLLVKQIIQHILAVSIVLVPIVLVEDSICNVCFRMGMPHLNHVFVALMKFIASFKLSWMIWDMPEIIVNVHQIKSNVCLDGET